MRGSITTLLLGATVAILANRLHQLGVVDLQPAAVEEKLKAALPPNFHPALETAFLRLKEFVSSGKQCGWLDEREYALASMRVVTPTGERPAGVVVKDGHIAAVLPLPEAAFGNTTELSRILGVSFVIDHGDDVIAPGLIDVHTHMNEPGREDWEGFVTGTKSASAGGFSMVVDMPLNSYPAMTTPELLKAKIEASSGKLHTKTALWGGLVPANAHKPEVLTAMAKGGVIGFKAFLSPSGINDFPNSSVEDVAAAMPTLRALGIPVMVHAELVDDSLEVEGDSKDYATYMATRPPSWEQNAIRGLLGALEADVEKHGQPPSGFSLHIAHLADADSIQMIQDAKAKGLPVTVETCVHYLNFAAEEIPNGDTRYKCAPPIRSAENRENLWKGLVAGSLDIVSTDHSPAPPELKKFDEGDFLTAWGGISGLQYALAGTWDGMQKRGMTPSQLTALWSTAPAKLIGISDLTGELAEGKKADILVWNPNELADTSRNSLNHKHKLTPYQDMKLNGKVVATYVDGQQVFDGEKGVFGGSCATLHLKK